jgi:hypothetical protein
MKSKLEQFISDNREAFKRPPNSEVLQRIQQQIKKTERERSEKVFVISSRLRWAAAACLIFLAGSVTFFALQQKDVIDNAVATEKTVTPKQSTVIPAPVTASNENDNSVTAEKKQHTTTGDVTTAPIEEAGDNNKTLLFAKLGNSESASQRLLAAYEIKKLPETDKDIVDALTKVMNTDANTNVRLAALEALSKFSRESYVKKKLLSSLEKQKDPLVQIALIELLSEMKEKSIIKELHKIVNDPKTIQPVKDQAYAGMFTLRS